MNFKSALFRTALFSAVFFFVSSFSKAQTYSPWSYYTFESSANALTDSMAHGNLDPNYYGCNYSIAANPSNTGVGKYLTFPTVSGMMAASNAVIDTAFTFECLFRPGFEFSGTQLFSSSTGYVSARIGYPYISFTTSHKNASNVTVNDEFLVSFDGVGKKSYGYYIDGNWHHFVFRINVKTGVKQIWIDGELPTGFSNSIAPGTFPAAVSNIIYINTLTTPLQVHGDLDEVAIYRYDLHPNMIYKHYQNFVAHQHYSFSYTSTPPPTAASVTAGIDINDFPPGHPTPTVNAVNQVRNFPAPRYKPGNTLIPNVPVWNFYFLGGLFQSGITNQQAIWNQLDIQRQLISNFNYPVTIGMSISDYLRYDDTTDFPGACLKLANQNPTVPAVAYSYWGNINPTNAGKYANQTYINCGCLPTNSYLKNSSSQYIDLNGNVTTSKILSPDAPTDSIKLDGITNRFYLQQLTNRMTRPLNFLFENGEMLPYYLPNNAGLSQDASVVTDKNTTGLDWYTYNGNRFAKFVKAYRDEFITLPALANTKFAYYQIDGHDTYHQKYSEMRTINTQINGMNYATGDIYPRYPWNWRNFYSAWHGWQWVIESRYNEIAAGDKLFSPFISPGWDNNEEINIRPGQWLGFTKALAMLGAEFFYPGYFVESTPYQKPENYVWQIAIPAYTQAVTSRYEDLLRNGSLMNGDIPQQTGVQNSPPGYMFNAGWGDFRKLIVARKHNTLAKYAITGTLQPNSNMIGSAELEGVAQINLDGQTLKFKVRRQGSTFIYDKTNVSEPVFYQLDGWHESTHPYRWTKDFIFEGELFDNANTNLQIKTSVPAGTTAGDYTNFTSYVAFNAATAAQYNFAVRATATTYYLWIRARSKDGSSTNMTITMDGANSNQINCITDTNWRWYRISSTTSSAISFTNLSVNNHALQITSSNAKLYVDQVVLTPLSTAIYTSTTTACGAIATITVNGNANICSGDSVKLSANTATSYLWSNGKTSQDVWAKTSGTYTVTVTGNGGTATSTPATITVSAKPTAVISANQQLQICTGGNITLTATGGNSYLWTGGQTTANRVTTNAGTFTVTVTNTSGCSSTKTAKVTTAVCDPGCQVPQGLITNNITKTGAKLNWTLLTGVYQYYYQLKNNATGVTTAGYIPQNTPNIVLTGLTASTSYTWKVRTYCTSNTKSAFSVSVNFTTPALREGEMNGIEAGQMEHILIYPNPATDIIHIIKNVDSAQDCLTQIFDVTGKLVYEKEFALTEENFEMSIDVASFVKGIYFVKCSTVNETSYEKLIIQ